VRKLSLRAKRSNPCRGRLLRRAARASQ
jgi:hypothetical protein